MIPLVPLPLDLSTEVLSEAFDQSFAEPGIRASRIDPLAVIGDRQAKLSGKAIQRHHNVPLVSLGKAYFGIRHELVHNKLEQNRAVGRQGFTLDLGFEPDGGAIFFLHRFD
jgi:hypothetical protein